jgi:hypothetical protein
MLFIRTVGRDGNDGAPSGRVLRSRGGRIHEPDDQNCFRPIVIDELPGGNARNFLTTGERRDNLGGARPPRPVQREHRSEMGCRVLRPKRANPDRLMRHDIRGHDVNLCNPGGFGGRAPILVR